MSDEWTGPPSAEEWAIAREYASLIDAEYRRIGFTGEDFRWMGAGGPITRERFERALAELRAVPSGIGAVAYYARIGVDIVALRRRIEEDVCEEP